MEYKKRHFAARVLLFSASLNIPILCFAPDGTEPLGWSCIFGEVLIAQYAPSSHLLISVAGHKHFSSSQRHAGFLCDLPVRFSVDSHFHYSLFLLVCHRMLLLLFTSLLLWVKKKGVNPMERKNVSNYLLSITIGHMLLDRRLLKMNEFMMFEKKMCEKYGLPQTSIFRDESIIQQIRFQKR